jgi:hypothetical protein
MPSCSKVLPLFALSTALSAFAAGAPATPPSESAAAAPMPLNKAVEIAQSYKGSICDIRSNTSLLRYCHGFNPQYAVTAVSVLAPDTLIFVGNNGPIQSFSLSSLQLKTNSSHNLVLNNDWELTLPKVDAQSLVDALTAAKGLSVRVWGYDRMFAIIARTYASLAVKPPLPEDIRRYEVQAEDAVSRKDFTGAAQRYQAALVIAPWWPDGRFNLALVFGEYGQLPAAVVEMQRYLALVPNAPNARMAQDRIYLWQGRMTADDQKPLPEPTVPTIGGDGKPTLGVLAVNVPPIVAAARGLKDTRGALVLAVAPGSVAERGGVRPEDICVSIGGTPLTGVADFHTALVPYAGTPGSRFEVGIIRDTQPMSLQASF